MAQQQQQPSLALVLGNNSSNYHTGAARTPRTKQNTQNAVTDANEANTAPSSMLTSASQPIQPPPPPLLQPQTQTQTQMQPHLHASPTAAANVEVQEQQQQQQHAQSHTTTIQHNVQGRVRATSFAQASQPVIMAPLSTRGAGGRSSTNSTTTPPVIPTPQRAVTSTNTTTTAAARRTHLHNHPTAATATRTTPAELHHASRRRSAAAAAAATATATATTAAAGGRATQQQTAEEAARADRGPTTAAAAAATLGLSTADARRRLVQTVHGCVNEFCEQNRFPWRLVLVKEACQWPVLAILLCSAFLVACYAQLDPRDSHFLVSACALTAMVVFNLAANTYCLRLRHREVILLFWQRAERAMRMPTLSNLSASVGQPPADGMVRVLRDNTWRILPVNVLVRGDILWLNKDEQAARPPLCRVRVLRRQAVAATGAATAAGGSNDQGLDDPSVDEIPPLPPGMMDTSVPSHLDCSRHRVRMNGNMCIVTRAPAIAQIQQVLFRSIKMEQQQDGDGGLGGDDENSILFCLLQRESPIGAGLPRVFGSGNMRGVDKEYLRSPASAMVQYVQHVLRIQTRILLIGLVLAVVISCVRLATLTDGDGFRDFDVWFRKIVAQHVTLALVLLPVSLPIFLFVVDVLSSGILLATLESVQHRLEGENTAGGNNADKRVRRHRRPYITDARKAPMYMYDDVDADDVGISSDSEDADDGEENMQAEAGGDDEDVSDATTYAFIDKLRMPFWAVVKHMYAILSGRHHVMSRLVNPVTELGSVSMFCVLDGPGVLSQNDISANHVLFLSPPPKEKPVVLDLIQTVRANNHGGRLVGTRFLGNRDVNSRRKLHEDRRGQGAGVDFDAPGEFGSVNGPISRGCIQFEGDIQQHLPSLKPLGLSIILNSSCSVHPAFHFPLHHLPNWPLAMRASISPGGADSEAVVSSGNVAAWPWGAMVAPPPVAPRHSVLAFKPGFGFDPSDFMRGIYIQRELDAEGALSFSQRPGSCVCELGSEMGFDVWTTRRRFNILKALYCVAERGVGCDVVLSGNSAVASKENESLRQFGAVSDDGAACHGNEQFAGTVSFVMQDRVQPRQLQLITKGHPALVLQHCSHFWDGHDLQVLTPNHLSRIYEIVRQWRHLDLSVAAYAYAPLAPQPKDFLKPPHVHYIDVSLDPAAKRSREDECCDLEDMKTADESAKMRSEACDSSNPAPHAGAVILQDQVFVGLVSMRDKPKPHMVSFVERLMQSGARFVYFSADNEAATKAHGSQLGLFTDFNSWCSLRDPSPFAQSVSPAMTPQKRRNEDEFFNAGDEAPICLSPVSQVQDKNRLPNGVSAIRTHIEEVDNVPLLISLFTDCTPTSVTEMVRIYQEHGESVFCVGSSLSAGNTEIFLQANVAACVDPWPAHECSWNAFPAYRQAGFRLPTAGVRGADTMADSYAHVFEIAFSKVLTSLPCLLSLTYNAPFSMFTALLCESRRLLATTQQCLWFAFASGMFLFGILLVGRIVGAPPLMEVYHVLWLLWFSIPILSVSLMASRRHPNLMRRLPYKNGAHLEVPRLRFTVYFLARFFPSVLGFHALFYTWLHDSYERNASAASAVPVNIDEFFWWNARYGENVFEQGRVWEETLFLVQNWAQFAFLAVLVVLSSGFVDRTRSVWRGAPMRINPYWFITSLCLLLIQLVWSAIAASTVGADISVDTGAKVWYAVILWPIVIVFVDELCKWHDRRYCRVWHRRSRIQFETVLGMHSPK